jgi:antitoxin VapB
MVKAKIFQNGRSQAVRLPKGFRMPGKELSISRLGNGILLQPVLKSWLDVYRELKPVENFMDDYKDLPLQDREGF